MEEVNRLKALISQKTTAPQHEALLPCIMLPLVKTTFFYDRNDIIAKISERFGTSSPENTQVRAIALFGLGGVGKSQVALKYVHSKAQEFDAIGWIHSQTTTAMAQSFTDLAVRLKLHGAHPQHHTANRALVLSWLQKTCRLGSLIS